MVKSKDLQQKKEKEENLLDDDIMKIINEKHQNSFQKYKNSLKKNKKRNKIIKIIMIIVILITLALMVVFNYTLEKKFINDCMETGHTKNYCISKS